MGSVYAFLNALKGERPKFDNNKRLPEEQAEFLLKDNNMQGIHLGACLDSCRWGSQTTVMFEMNVKDMVHFVQNWMLQNKDGFQYLWHEKRIDELYSKFELPYINHKKCPVNPNHKDRIEDFSNIIRCANIEKKYYKPSFVEVYDFFDPVSKVIKRRFDDPEPYDLILEHMESLSPKKKKEYENYLEQLNLYDNEKPTLRINDVCYEILSDKKTILSLEEVVKRLNLTSEFETVYCHDYINGCQRVNELNPQERIIYESLSDHCPGHKELQDKIEFPFDGWDLAFYARKWYEQKPEGTAALFNS